MKVESKQAFEVENFGIAPKDWDDCPICMDIKDEPLAGHTVKLTGQDVTHKYHKSCLFEAMKNDTRCPECRTPLTSRDIREHKKNEASLSEAPLFEIDSPAANYLFDIGKNLKYAIPLAASAALFTSGVNAIMSQGFSPNLNYTLAGAAIGAAASHTIRKICHLQPISHANQNKVEYLNKLGSSSHFKCSVAATAAIASIAAFSAQSLTVIPMGLLGFGIHYGAQKLCDRGYITLENKEQSQKIASLVTNTFCLYYPLQVVGLMSLGAAIGVFLKIHF